MKLSHVLRIKNVIEVTKRVEREVSIKAPWGNIAALSWGDPSNPPVLLCHGILDSCSSFRPLVSLLPENFFYVSVDLPGNGRSDHLPKGIRYSVIDFVPTLLRVKEHFRWDKFMFVGHSLGVVIGKYYNIAYPDIITRAVELDYLPAYSFTWEPNELWDWYHRYYANFYSDVGYAKMNGDPETSPTYTYEEVLKRTMDTRSLSKEAAEQILERCLERTGDGKFRITYDQRMKLVTLLPFPRNILQEVYTASTTPTLVIIAKKPLEIGIYDTVPFIKDEKAWPNNNYKVIIADGHHDVHIENPSCMADDIKNFLLYGLTKRNRQDDKF